MSPMGDIFKGQPPQCSACARGGGRNPAELNGGHDENSTVMDSRRIVHPAKVFLDGLLREERKVSDCLIFQVRRGRRDLQHSKQIPLQRTIRLGVHGATPFNYFGGRVVHNT